MWTASRWRAGIKRRGRLPPDEVRRIMAETADALSAAHAVGVIHRDIKPDNILLEGSRGRVMVTDFGIAKALSSSSGATLTGAGVAIGTPSFMSPEQAAGEREIDGRSDLYSLGIVGYQMLTGELPFSAPTVAGILMKQITEVAPDVRSLRGDVPGGSRAGGEPLPGEGPAEPVAHGGWAPPGARDPHRDRLPADRARIQGGQAGTAGTRAGPRRERAGNRRKQAGASRSAPLRPPASPPSPRPFPPVAARSSAASRPPAPFRQHAAAADRRARGHSPDPGAVREVGGDVTGLLRDQRRDRDRHALVPLPHLRDGDRAAHQLRKGLAGGLQLA